MKNKMIYKHSYIDCIIKENDGIYTFLSLGRKCKHCDHLIIDKLLFTNKIPEAYKDLPVVIKGN